VLDRNWIMQFKPFRPEIDLHRRGPETRSVVEGARREEGW
jgi:hypothetical protein